MEILSLKLNLDTDLWEESCQQTKSLIHLLRPHGVIVRFERPRTGEHEGECDGCCDDPWKGDRLLVGGEIATSFSEIFQLILGAEESCASLSFRNYTK